MSERAKHLGNENRRKRRKLFYLPVFVIAIVIGCSIAAGISGLSIRSTVATIEAVSLGVYWDSGCTTAVGSINWGELYPGSSKTVDVYVRNEGNASADLSLATSDWQPSETSQYLGLSWDYNGRTLYPNVAVPVALKLSVSSGIRGIESFSFNIVVSPVEAMFDVRIKLDPGLDQDGYVVGDLLLYSSEVLNGGLEAYMLSLSISEDIAVVSVLGGDAPFSEPPAVSRADGQIVVSASISGTQGPQMNGLCVGRLRLRLGGMAGAECTIRPLTLTVVDAGSKTEYVAVVHGETSRFRRGDANKDGQISIADAMFIAQYLAGNRPGSHLNLLNAASVKQDGAEGDDVSIADAMIVQQYLVGSRDGF
jgi:hypothetical protein